MNLAVINLEGEGVTVRLENTNNHPHPHPHPQSKQALANELGLFKHKYNKLETMNIKNE